MTMDQRQTHQQTQQGGPQGNAGPTPIAPNPNGMAKPANTQQNIANQGQGMASHLMGLMTNPALAAAAAASPLFPPAAMLTNPGAVFAMPDIFASTGGVNPLNGQTIQAATAPAGVVLQQAAVQPNVTGSATIYTTNIGKQQLQQIQPAPPHIAQMQGGQPSIVSYGAVQMSQNDASARPISMAGNGVITQGVPLDSVDSTKGDGKATGKRKKDMSPAEKAKQNRDRNREHARSTRLRKKAYIQKLKDLVEGLHAERTEEVRQRRVAIQHLAEMQNVRRAVIHSFLRYHSNYEMDKRKWGTILEDSFWLKQPVTPYRCFRRSEIENECRMSRGVLAVIADAASVAAMIEGVGSRSVRWMQIKREDFFLREEERTGRKHMPRNIVGQNSQFQQAVSSLSSSSNSSNNSSGGEEVNKKQQSQNKSGGTQSISNLSGASQEMLNPNSSEDLHDYHAKPLPDPKLADSERSSTFTAEDSPEESVEDTKHVSTDSSSGDDSAAAIKNPHPPKRRKHDKGPGGLNTAGTAAAFMGGNKYLPQNIAKKGGISHNVRPVVTNMSLPRNGNARLSLAPAIPLPPFAGIGKRSQLHPPNAGTTTTMVSKSTTDNSQLGGRDKALGQHEMTRRRTDLANAALEGPAVIPSGDVESSSSNSSRNRPQTRGYYHVNEDDMILMEDILMCPFVFRTQDAVLCGALAECIMPGMLRAHFSSRNKLQSLEMSYDAMGFMQQLERASGSGMTAQIIPGSLEMALSPTANEARVITLAEPPFKIVNVNEAWTKLTKYTQMDAEGVEFLKLMDGETQEDHLLNPPYPLEDIVEGRCHSSTRLHYDKDGKEFVDFISSYPLTNSSDEITHILHISKELPPLQGPEEREGISIDDIH